MFGLNALYLYFYFVAVIVATHLGWIGRDCARDWTVCFEPEQGDVGFRSTIFEHPVLVLCRTN